MGGKKYVFDFFCSFVRTLGVHVSYMIDIHAAPRQGPLAPRSQGVISASVVVAPG